MKPTVSIKRSNFSGFGGIKLKGASPIMKQKKREKREKAEKALRLNGI